VTRSVGTVVPGSFRDPAFVLRLDLAFAGLFFDALRHWFASPPSAHTSTATSRSRW
jgi:Family of unknown function (DUF5995)